MEPELHVCLIVKRKLFPSKTTICLLYWVYLKLTCHNKFCPRAKHFNEITMYFINEYFTEDHRYIKLTPITIFIHYCLCSLFVLALFTYNFILILFERQRDKKDLHLLVQPRLVRPSTRNLIQFSHMGGRNPGTWAHHLLSAEVYISRTQ